jgi:superfamily II DNA or RNA helicase
VELREHQREAVAAIVAAAAAGERRMTVVAACGSGKTLIAQRAAQCLAPGGAVLVLMPTKALLTQTARRWRETGQPGLALGVCSLSQAASGLAPGEAVLTRHPRAIARAMRVGGPVTVFATYASLHRIQRAHELHQLPAWDLVIADEAHRTCSAFGDGWGTVHDDAAIPAKTRVYMTATPRVWGAAAPQDLVPFLERVPLATMDHQEVFGPTVFNLGMAQAIDRGILADYQVLLPVVEEADLHAVLSARRPAATAHHSGLRNGAVQVAVLRAIREQGLRRVLVFHNRVALAEAFAESLPRTAEEVGAPLRIEGLWARAIHSRQSGEWRRDLLEDFARAECLCAVLSNVRVLNEGVDMPDVDGVVFADPRYSTIDAIQAIGRGLRQPPNAGKKTTLVIPVYLRPGTDTADLLHDSAFANLLTLLQALRAHDESFMDRIALPSRSSSTTVQGREVFYAQPERTAQLARALGLEITLPAIGSWEQALVAAATYHAAFGHLDVPVDYTGPDGFALGQCLASIRLRHLLGRLPAKRKQVLDALGFSWSSQTPTFTTMLGYARAWADRHGHLTVPVKEDFGGHPLGQWLARQRHKATAGHLPAEQQQALDAIDPHWNPPWPQDWQRKYHRAKAALAAGTRWNSLSEHGERSRDHRAAVEWLYKQQLRFFRLDEGQQELLLALHVPPMPDGVYYNHGYDYERHAFYNALGHLAAFMAREGHVKVPYDHLEPYWWGDGGPQSSTFDLGQWFHRCLAYPQALTREQSNALDALLRIGRRPRLGRTLPLA